MELIVLEEMTHLLQQAPLNPLTQDTADYHGLQCPFTRAARLVQRHCRHGSLERNLVV